MRLIFLKKRAHQGSSAQTLVLSLGVFCCFIIKGLLYTLEGMLKEKRGVPG